MRASTAYIVGAGTIIAALGLGLGGGMIAANIMNPLPPKVPHNEVAHNEVQHKAGAEAGKETSKETSKEIADRITRLERSGSPDPMPAANALPYVAATLAFSAPPTGAAPAAQGQQPKTDTARSAPPAAQPARTSASKFASKDEAARPADQTAAVPAAQAGNAPAQSSAPQNSAPQDAFAKARDADLKRAAEKRKADRQQRWADQRRYQPQHDQQTQETRDVGQRGWDDGEQQRLPEDRRPRVFVEEPERFGFPQLRLFGPDDD